MVIPCNQKNTLYGGTTDGIPDDCNWEKEAAIDYIGDINIIAYHNRAYFRPNKYGPEAVEKTSLIHKERSDQHKPNWFPL